MVVDSNWFEPASDSEEDIEAAERYLLFTVRYLESSTDFFYIWFMDSTAGLPIQSFLETIPKS